MFAADAATFLADTGESVSWTNSTTAAVLKGLMLFELPDAETASGSIISREYEVTFETAAWPNLLREEVLVIDGAGGGLRYKLRTDPRVCDDAVFSSVKLSRI